MLLLRIYLCMYLPQPVPLPPSIGALSDFFGRAWIGQESQLEPTKDTSSLVVPLLPAVTPHSRPLSRVRTQNLPGQDRSGPPSPVIGDAPGLQEPSGLKGLHICFITVELLDVLCTCFYYVYICVCTCRSPYRCRHQSEPYRTSSGVLGQARRASQTDRQESQFDRDIQSCIDRSRCASADRVAHPRPAAHPEPRSVDRVQIGPSCFA